MHKQSKEFFDKFQMIFSPNSEFREKAVDCYNRNTAFTNFIIERINKIIESMGYMSQNEYLRIDAIGYTTKKENLEPLPGLNAHLWDLQIAVEHENDPKDWLDEVVKLSHICCPLRVIIGYVPAECRNTEEDRLEYASKILQQLQCKDNLRFREFMVVLGNSGVKTENDYFNYKAYVLNHETFMFDPLEV